MLALLIFVDGVGEVVGLFEQDVAEPELGGAARRRSGRPGPDPTIAILKAADTSLTLPTQPGPPAPDPKTRTHLSIGNLTE